jgi:hypothetical protein
MAERPSHFARFRLPRATYMPDRRSGESWFTPTGGLRLEPRRGNGRRNSACRFFCGARALRPSTVPRGRTSTRNDADRTLQLPLRQLPEGVGNGAGAVEGDRGVADGFPAETVADRIDGAVGEEARHPSPGPRAPGLVGEAER